MFVRRSFVVTLCFLLAATVNEIQKAMFTTKNREKNGVASDKT